MTVRRRRLSVQVLPIAAVAWAVLILPATAQTEDPLAAAKTLYSERKYEEARAEAEQLLDGETARDAGLIIANCDRLLKHYEDAIEHYEELLEQNTQDSIALSALIGLADSLQRLGRFDESEKILDRATRLYPEATDARLAVGGSSLYTRNRAQYESAVDFARGQLRQLGLRCEAAGDASGALLAYRKLYHSYPYHPDAPQVALKLAELLEGEAASVYYLRALDSGYDRCFSTQAQLAVNQLYLDTVCKPPDEEQLAAALSGLFQLADDDLPSLTAGWCEALAETYEPFSDHGRATWKALGKGKPWAALCSLAVARSYIRDGLYQQAIDSLTDLPEEPSLRQHRNILLAQAYLGLRRFEDAIQHARQSLHGPDRVLAGQAHLLTGRAAEMALNFDSAARAYRVAAIECPAEWDRQQADYALKRVEELRALPTAKPRVAVLPDDRTTRGDWFLGYGREHYILCAQNFVLDRTGGLGPRLEYDYATASDHEPGRRWVTKKADEDPVALWDPALQTHKPANWDDHGEQEPIGAGPDLLVSLEVPRGAHALSLYFVNDYNYYEPNRYYTISITAESNLQAVTDVEHFGGGVYKRFVVQGPVSLKLRIWRNLSINTLLSGVFLDPLPRMEPAPPVAVAYPDPRTEALAKRCRTIDGCILNKPLSMPEQIASLDRLIADISHDSPELSWVLSEALRARGQFRASDKAFDVYLAEIPERCLLTERADAHARVAEELIDRDQPEVIRRHLLPAGTHRWDRACAAHFAALASRHSGDDLTDTLIAFAREHNHYPTAFAAAMAFDRIAELSPEVSDTPVMLLERARALDRAKRPWEAVPVLQRLLEKDLSTGVRTDASWLLLRMQVSAGAEAGEVRATYDSMLQLTPTEQQRRDGLYLVAAALIGAGDGATARDLPNQYESEYGATEATQALLRRSEP